MRGRPVGFEPSHFGGALVAIERGYFPVSSTGYRSLAGNFRGREIEPPSISASFLESLALTEEKSRRALLAQLARAPRPEPDPLGNFIVASSGAAEAVQVGLFAPDAERAALWRGAYRLLCLIDADRRFQPACTAPAWTPAACAASLAVERELLCSLRELAAGNFSRRPPGLYHGVSAYFDLPPKPGGETMFALPVITPEFTLGLPLAAPDRDDEVESDAVLAVSAAPAGEDPQQLTFL